ncbi:hypothetical protein H0A36_10085 [Endozoicomonas sp. SM1973]|uniref:Uncharacterized protein n=1 Tax=Spartinivicinus marinus TaxID=2994442 RepID=A0A853HX88_9GAMM|nr:hypothetical protein [Spartinivicinus marinus]MCX4027468.1 hypothetical protein [Spartinivicinus marinus]NYZ66360.1 hypothetical protein [Spartinivicinus marinus]
MNRYQLAVIAVVTGGLISYLSFSLTNSNHQEIKKDIITNKTDQSIHSDLQPVFIKKITASHYIIQQLLSYDKSSLLLAAIEGQPQLTNSFELITQQCPSTQTHTCIALFGNLLPKNHPKDLKKLLINLYRLYLADQFSNSKTPEPLIANSLQEVLGNELFQTLKEPQASQQLTSLFQRLENESKESEQYEQTLFEIESLLDNSLTKQESLAAELKLLEHSSNKSEQEILKQAKAIQDKYYSAEKAHANPLTQKQHQEYQQQELAVLENIDKQYPHLTEVEKQRIISSQLAELRAKIYYPTKSNTSSEQNSSSEPALQ